MIQGWIESNSYYYFQCKWLMIIYPSIRERLSGESSRLTTEVHDKNHPIKYFPVPHDWQQ